VRRFVLFHDKRHPLHMGAPEVEAFLTHLAWSNVYPLLHRIRQRALCFFCTRKCSASNCPGSTIARAHRRRNGCRSY
jgi:hypothetical protein